jgi:hypothetical protein
VDTSDVFITTFIKTTSLTVPAHVPVLPTVPSLDGTTTLSTEEHLLASTKY